MSRAAPSIDAESVTGIDRLVHEPARLLLLATLFVVDSADFVFLMKQTGLTAGNIASHLSRLESAGYVELTKSFVDKRPQTVVRLTDSGRRALERYRSTLSTLLGSLAGVGP